MDEALAWKRLSLPDATVREEACNALFGCLRERIQRRLSAHYRADAEDAADAVQNAFLKLHQAAGRHVWPNEKAGRVWLYRTVRTCYIDLLRQKGRFSYEPLSPDEPNVDRDFVEQIQHAIVLGELFHYADAFWLGLNPALSPASYNRLLLAAQMYYLEGWSPEEISRLIRPQEEDAPEMTPVQIRQWVCEDGAVRLLAYHTLCIEHPRLLAHLLSMEEEQTSQEALNALWSRALACPPEQPVAQNPSPEVPAIGDLVWGIVALILLRYRNNIPASAVPQQQPCSAWSYSAGQIQEMIDAIRQWLPFSDLMAELIQRLLEERIELEETLCDPGLWKRMAFQYWYRDEIPLLDVYERIAPAAEQVEYRLNTGMLNTWLCGGALRKRLLVNWWAYAGGEDDE